MKASLAVSSAAAVAYGITAVAANFVVKHALMFVPLPLALLELQLLTTLLIVQGLRACRLVSLPPVTLARARQHMGVSAAYVLHALLVLLSLSTLNIPMYNTLKRVTPVIVLTVKSCTERSLPAPQLIASVLLIVLGCVVAGVGDLSFSLYGYSLALSCAAMQAAYMLMAERLASGEGCGSSSSGSGSGSSSAVQLMAHMAEDPNAKDPNAKTYRGMVDAEASAHAQHGPGGAGSAGPPARKQLGADACEQLYYMALVGIPAIAVPLMLSGQAPQLPGALYQARSALGLPAFGPWLLSAAGVECVLTGTLLLCTHLNSALTTSIVAVLKSAVAVLLGFFFLGGVRFSMFNVLGICMNLLGGVWYSVVKYSSAR